MVGVLGEGFFILGGEKIGRNVGGVCWDIEKWRCAYGRRKSNLREFFFLHLRERERERRFVRCRENCQLKCRKRCV